MLGSLMSCYAVGVLPVKSPGKLRSENASAASALNRQLPKLFRTLVGVLYHFVQFNSALEDR